ncbi:MAG: type I restriction enzyme HsdR N-terminal domain-containing protein [Sedimentisphaerales bacterium]|nr:type I restriction enzyme HsdR N-terminal domain-containing protein [Sedimentisphaerales bacterium]
MAIDYFDTFDFSCLASQDFKEDSVREVIIVPLLHSLGYADVGLNMILRSKTVSHPFVHIGSQKRPVNLIPDYTLSVGNKPAWVLDAKAPSESVQNSAHLEQVYSYAIHPDIRVKLFALCNGKELSVYQIDRQEPLLYVHLSEINRHWQTVYDALSPQAFKVEQAAEQYRPQQISNFNYATRKPLTEITDLKKQSAKRHYGVHPYFTKQVWNVVQEYIKNFSKPGDLVLDPYGGSGITAIEALVLGRKAIHIDINPLSIFLTQSLIAPVDLSEFSTTYRTIIKQFEQHAPRAEHEIEQALNTYPYPKMVKLPSNSDVDTIEQLFTSQQLAQLAYLKSLIVEIQDNELRNTFLLMFSGLLNKINLTYHASKGRSEGRGDSGVFRYYRYRLAPEPAILDILQYFESRFKKVLAAKKELAAIIPSSHFHDIQILKGSATDLHAIETESVDYIYTDPPYGKKIQYLDLSILWNAWLDLPVTPEDYDVEAIEGGKLEKSKEAYSQLLAQSIEEMYRTLKFDRWMSFVFAHKDPSYWHLIVETAEQVGFEYMGAVKQSNGKETFKKRQNPFTVLSGQLIINFRKVKTPQVLLKLDLGKGIANVVIEAIEGIIARKQGATLEEIHHELILKGLELGFLDALSKEYRDLTPLLNSHFTFDAETQTFHIPQSTSFRTCIDVRLRIRYFLLSYLRRQQKEKHTPTFDEIILHIMPLLKNGVTPEEQTILGVLEDIAERTSQGKWRLSNVKQISLFE